MQQRCLTGACLVQLQNRAQYRHLFWERRQVTVTVSQSLRAEEVTVMVTQGFLSHLGWQESCNRHCDDDPSLACGTPA